MPLRLNGVEIDDLRINGIEVDDAYVNGEHVYNRFVNKIFSTSHNFLYEIGFSSRDRILDLNHQPVNFSQSSACCDGEYCYSMAHNKIFKISIATSSVVKVSPLSANFYTVFYNDLDGFLYGFGQYDRVKIRPSDLSVVQYYKSNYSDFVTFVPPVLDKSGLHAYYPNYETKSVIKMRLYDLKDVDSYYVGRRVDAMIFSNNGLLYVVSDDRFLHVLNPADMRGDKINLEGLNLPAHSISRASISNYSSDGNIYFGTYNLGVLIYDTSSYLLKVARLSVGGVAGGYNTIRSLAVDDKYIYAAANGGDGTIVTLDKNSLEEIGYTKDNTNVVCQLINSKSPYEILNR